MRDSVLRSSTRKLSSTESETERVKPPRMNDNIFREDFEPVAEADGEMKYLNESLSDVFRNETIEAISTSSAQSSSHEIEEGFLQELFRKDISIVLGIFISFVLLLTIMLIIVFKWKSARNEKEFPKKNKGKSCSNSNCWLFKKVETEASVTKYSGEHNNIDELTNSGFSSSSASSSRAKNSFNFALEMAIQEDKQALEQGFINRKVVKNTGDYDLNSFYDLNRTSSYNKRLAIISSSKKENAQTIQEEDVILNTAMWVSDEDTKSGILNSFEDCYITGHMLPSPNNNKPYFKQKKGLTSKQQKKLEIPKGRKIEFPEISSEEVKTSFQSENIAVEEEEVEVEEKEDEIFYLRSESIILEDVKEEEEIQKDEEAERLEQVSLATSLGKTTITTAQTSASEKVLYENSSQNTINTYSSASEESTSFEYTNAPSSVSPDVTSTIEQTSTSYMTSESEKVKDSSAYTEADESNTYEKSIFLTSGGATVQSVDDSSLTNSTSFVFKAKAKSSSSSSSKDLHNIFPKKIRVKKNNTQDSCDNSAGDTQDEIDAILEDELFLPEESKSSQRSGRRRRKMQYNADDSSCSTKTNENSHSSGSTSSAIESFLEREMETFFEENVVIRTHEITQESFQGSPSSSDNVNTTIFSTPEHYQKKVRFHFEQSPSAVKGKNNFDLKKNNQAEIRDKIKQRMRNNSSTSTTSNATQSIPIFNTASLNEKCTEENDNQEIKQSNSCESLLDDYASTSNNSSSLLQIVPSPKRSIYYNENSSNSSATTTTTNNTTKQEKRKIINSSLSPTHTKNHSASKKKKSRHTSRIKHQSFSPCSLDEYLSNASTQNATAISNNDINKESSFVKAHEVMSWLFEGEKKTKDKFSSGFSNLFDQDGTNVMHNFPQRGQQQQQHMPSSQFLKLTSNGEEVATTTTTNWKIHSKHPKNIFTASSSSSSHDAFVEDVTDDVSI